MPPPSQPPRLSISQSIFDDLNAMSYDSTSGAFLDANNTLQFLFIDVDSNGNPRWTYSADSSSIPNALAKATQLTADVLAGGTYQTQSGAIAYNGQNYGIRLERNSNGATVANAHVL